MKIENKEQIEKIWYEWEDDVEFKIADIPKVEKFELLERSKKMGKSWKRQSKGMEMLDIMKFNDLHIRKVIVGWKGVKNKHLLEILDSKKGDEWKFEPRKGKEDRKETEVPFSVERVRELAECHSTDFLDFLNSAVGHIEDLYKELKERELKN